MPEQRDHEAPLAACSWVELAKGRSGGSGWAKRRAVAQRHADAALPVHCQRFFTAGRHSAYFEVFGEQEERQQQEGARVGPPQSVAHAVLHELSALEGQQLASHQAVRGSANPREVSLWLELTRWTDYLEGCRLADAAALAALPNCNAEPVLAAISEALNRTVEQAYRSICADRINVFDQVRINSFL